LRNITSFFRPELNRQAKLDRRRKRETRLSDNLPSAYLARHGNTAWTHSGQDTGLTDLSLTPEGERNAVRLGERLKGLTVAKVLPVRCSVLLEPANSPDLGRSPKPMATWRNGTMGNMKG
jgi:Histidine phosphatase superfamily (branch 1)